MLSDLITSLTTRCSPHIRHLGYVQETLAMRKRHRARREAWQEHLDNSRRFVLSAAARCRTRNKIVVLGSGLLLDVPLAELTTLFREVVLVDVVCLPEIRKRIARYGNAFFFEHDVTGVAEQLYRMKLSNGIHELPGVPGPSEMIAQDADLVVSLNILSQLWVVPRAYILQPRPRVSEDQLGEWCARIVERHYLFLQGLPCTVCLIADHQSVNRDKDGKVFSIRATAGTMELPEPAASWTWAIAPLGTESRSHSRELLVGAWHVR